MSHQDVGERLQLAARIGGARGVRGRVQQHPLGLRPDRGLEVLRLELERRLDGGVDEDRRTAAQGHHFRIRHPIGPRHDHLVARIEGREERVVDHLLAAGADDGLRGLVGEPVLTGELRRDRLAQRRDAGDRRILRLATADSGDRCVLDVVRRIEIGLTDGQADHVAPLRPQVAGLLRDHDRRRRLDAREGVGEKAHV